ncbi:universal stress protein [Pseudonocardia acaciae]|uniref:universal stress protein n=1 Tax=Pseudonocardia acaciae TaxID=551276 RepID=UPI00048B420E|nr:universal stress protein [Pseudonocardia acaciae]
MAGRNIVVGVDGSDSALAAVRWAAVEARRWRSPVRLVGVCPWPDHHFGGEALGLDYRQAFVRIAREQVEAAVEVAAATAPSVEVHRQVIVGYPVPVLAAESKRARLVVLGDRGLGGVTGLLVGSVAVGLAARGVCPVVVVRGEPPVALDSPLPVVVGVDGAERSEAALAFGFEAASARGVPLVAVHTWRDDRIDPIFEDWERRVLAERLAGWSEKYPDVAVRRVVSRDGPAHRLLAEAERAQLVVVGSHGRGDFTGLVLGSVGHALLHRAPCPVAVVRPEKP